jgi:hypothetical protein
LKISVSLCSCLFASFVLGQGFKPREGFVPGKETATKIAEAVLIPVCGKDSIENEKPFTATLKGNTWTVRGTLRCADGKGGTTTVNCHGGVAVVEMSKSDARILSMIHYQ